MFATFRTIYFAISWNLLDSGHLKKTVLYVYHEIRFSTNIKTDIRSRFAVLDKNK